MLVLHRKNKLGRHLSYHFYENFYTFTSQFLDKMDADYQNVSFESAPYKQIPFLRKFTYTVYVMVVCWDSAEIQVVG